MRSLPEQNIVLAKSSEGFHRTIMRGIEITAVPYVCPAGFWTIGYGSLCSRDHPPITLSEGELLLARDMQDALRNTLALCPSLAIASDARLAAIVDFTFNLGAGRLMHSTLRKRVNAQDWLGAAEEIRKWVWGGGKKLPGLVLRREIDARLLL